ncbi:MAG: hypothetical protein KatS3mg011_0037 [Acidimicrobiia bacterium]|nr:MAG: hypothetical protein KatS3mg011_0037 [Acidimicrobiia bacterium]
MRVEAGRLDDLPESKAVVAADGRVVVVRTEDGVRAFENRCLHRGSSFEGARISDGVMTCPAHFWRYRISDGRLVADPTIGLSEVPCEVVDGRVWIELPEPETASIRQVLLRHAREWRRQP